MKLQRFLRALVLFRMLRASKVVYEYLETQMSTATVVLRTIQFAVLILWIAHVVACVWFALGRYAPAGRHESHWIDDHRAGPNSEYAIADMDALYQFTSSYHWALAQITLGGLDINPRNSWERLLAIICNFFGLLFGGVVVSILSSTMIGLREKNHGRLVKMRTLREFLLQHGTRLGIRLRVVRQVQDRMVQHGKVFVESDVEALSLISGTLLRELRHSLYSRLVMQHPLLHSWRLLQADSIKVLCNEGVYFRVLLPDDELFATGAPAQRAYVVQDGSLSYTQTYTEGFVDHEAEAVEDLHEGAWISEAAWWCHWFHVGTACALSPTTLLSLPAETVLSTMYRDPVVCAISIEYGINFHKHIIYKDAVVTDTNLQHADFNGMICNLPKEVHVILGMAALQQIEGSHQRAMLDRTGNLKRLEAEIREGRSLLLLDHDGNLHRRVALTMMQLSKEDDEDGSLAFLTQVAAYDYETESWKPDLRMPGVKQQTGESHHEAFQRLLRSNFGECNWKFVPAEWYRDIENQDSQQYGVYTQYIKMAGVVQLTDEIQAELEDWAVPMQIQQRGESKLVEMVSKSYPMWPSLVQQAASSLTTSPEDLLSLTLQLAADGVFKLGKKDRGLGLYIWMRKDCFSRLKTQSSILQRLVSQLLEKCCLTDEEPSESEAVEGSSDDAKAMSAQQALAVLPQQGSSGQTPLACQSDLSAIRPELRADETQQDELEYVLDLDKMLAASCVNGAF
eukprot:CAMPEP_0178384750 /NCGR_PEP_ID=MMETSP0689_2-20121128/7676_1 /TAXON_ID=160604 /ORGANISM="Amphidinium massartii, Strain CS-259" /LENGTH=736 /DNA_ID=CAMNT_0020005007 /DNA_START=244 /DNA_END=2454 /DNA_ORIENTATION=+